MAHALPDEMKAKDIPVYYPNRSIISSPAAPTAGGTDTVTHEKLADAIKCPGYLPVSIDVECAAIGVGHWDLAPTRIALCIWNNSKKQTMKIKEWLVRVEHITDPLTMFTGLSEKEIINAPYSLKDALNELHTWLVKQNNKFEYGVYIIGQSVQIDIAWTTLIRGVHYTRFIDLAQTFRTGRYFYSLNKLVYAALNKDLSKRSFHDPVDDCTNSLLIWAYVGFGQQQKIDELKFTLKRIGLAKQFPDFRKQIKLFSPICNGMFNQNECVCYQPNCRGLITPEEVLQCIRWVQKTRHFAAQSQSQSS